MFKKSVGLLIVAVLLLLPAISQAKEIPPGRWWRLPYFSEPLKIDDQQKEALDKLYDYNRKRLMELKKELEQQKRDLTAMLDQESFSENTAMAQMKKLENTRTLLAATHFSYSLELRKLLGHDRFQQMKTLYRSWHGIKQ